MPKVLIVEDNEMNRDMLTRRLLRRGWDVSTAVDGRQGLEAAASQRPDLILMDMSLPELSGWEAVRMLKSEPELRRIPVIALTAHAMAGDREIAMEAGCDEFETKPVSLENLIAKMEGFCRKGNDNGQGR